MLAFILCIPITHLAAIVISLLLLLCDISNCMDTRAPIHNITKGDKVGLIFHEFSYSTDALWTYFRLQTDSIIRPDKHICSDGFFCSLTRAIYQH